VEKGATLIRSGAVIESAGTDLFPTLETAL